MSQRPREKTGPYNPMLIMKTKNPIPAKKLLLHRGKKKLPLVPEGNIDDIEAEKKPVHQKNKNNHDRKKPKSTKSFKGLREELKKSRHS
jgi:hypothetical protein